MHAVWVVMLHRTTLAALLVVALVATPASEASGALLAGPGRVAFPVAGAVPEASVDAAGATASVALPDGGAVLVATERGRGLVLARIRADGRPDPGFGRSGVARVAVADRPFSVLQVLRRPDGRLLVVAATAPRTVYEMQRMLLVGLTPQGAPDPSFGRAGVATPALQASCSGCEPAALQADGSVVVTGTVGRVSAAIEHDPSAPATFQWAAARVTTVGTTDPGFGGDGLVEVTPARGAGNGGYAAGVTAAGRIVLLGISDRGMRLTALLPDGTPDPGFHGGTPQTVPIPYGFHLLVRDAGPIDVLGADKLVRFTEAGQVERAFGADGVAELGPAGYPRQMLDEGGGETLVYAAESFEPRPASRPALLVQRVGANGRVEATATLASGFAGGYASARAFAAPGLDQDAFLATGLLHRPDGSFLATGGVRVVRYTGEGVGFSSALFAVAAYTSGLAPDASFGGPLAPARVSVALPAQRATVVARRGRLRVRISTSGAGLVRLRVRDARRRVLAEAVAPAYAAGARTAEVPLTTAGRRVLRRARGVRVRIGFEFRDVVTARRAGARGGRLR